MDKNCVNYGSSWCIDFECDDCPVRDELQIVESDSIDIEKLRKALSKDFHDLYRPKYTTNWKAERTVRDVEIELIPFDHTKGETKMKTYEEIADHCSMEEPMRTRYIRYMKIRWADTEAQKCRNGYAFKWATRFLNGIEYNASDCTGQSVLRTLNDEQYTVECCSYDELPEQIKEDYLSDNGCGKEYASYLIVKHNGTIIRYESDAMEPEDARFYRDLSWIKEALLEAYNLGREDSNEQ